jgi:hypothetical protein
MKKTKLPNGEALRQRRLAFYHGISRDALRAACKRRERGRTPASPTQKPPPASMSVLQATPAKEDD